MSSEGDRMRRARIEFEEANARGCTIPELRLAKARDRQAEAAARLEARRRCGSRFPETAQDTLHRPRSPFLETDEPRREPWMMRD